MACRQAVIMAEQMVFYQFQLKLANFAVRSMPEASQFTTAV